MTFAIIETGGKQYKVKAGDKIKVEKLDEKSVTFNTLLVDDGQSTKMGEAAAKTKVTAEVITQGRQKKVMVIHYKPKVRHFKKYGHRQPYSEIQIGEIK